MEDWSKLPSYKGYDNFYNKHLTDNVNAVNVTAIKPDGSFKIMYCYSECFAYNMAFSAHITDGLRTANIYVNEKLCLGYDPDPLGHMRKYFININKTNKILDNLTGKELIDLIESEISLSM